MARCSSCQLQVGLKSTPCLHRLLPLNPASGLGGPRVGRWARRAALIPVIGITMVWAAAGCEYSPASKRSEAELAREREARQRVEAEVAKEREARLRVEAELAREREARQRTESEAGRRKVAAVEPPRPEVPRRAPVSEPPRGAGDAGKPALEAELHLKQGLSFAAIKDYDNAILEFTKAIDIDRRYATAYTNRAVAYMQQRKYNKAMDDLKQAEALNSRDKMVHYNYMALYSLQNQLDRALDSLDRALDLGFNNYDALRADPDLNNVRRHPEFTRVLEKHKVFIR